MTHAPSTIHQGRIAHLDPPQHWDYGYHQDDPEAAPADTGPRVQILSDLHLEVGQQYTSYAFPAAAPLLLLAGDIGRLIDYEGHLHFLNAQVSRYRRVFLVLGNHEFYGLDYETGLKEAQHLAASPSLAGGLVLLHRTRWDDPDSSLTVVGCTLWSAIPQDCYEVIASRVSDFREILAWTPQRHNEVHVEEVAWLREQVTRLNRGSTEDDGTRNRQLLVATHHAPCLEGTSRPEHSANPWIPAFATDLVDQKPSWHGVRLWVFGHTHYSTSFRRNGVRLVANQKWYVLPSGVALEQEGNAKGKSNRRKFDPAMFFSM